MNKWIIALLAILVILGLGFVIMSATYRSPSWSGTSDPGGETALPRVSTPAPDSVVQSPLLVRGEAPGAWFFEASLPIRLLDASGKEVAVAPGQAKGEWMTTDYVPFEATLTFTPPVNQTGGSLIIEKDNPSGLPEKAASFEVPIKFPSPTSQDGLATTTLAACRPAGCSGQVCTDEEDVITTCEFKPEYACYQPATCERQSDGLCGWTSTPGLRACLANPPADL